MTDDQPTAFDVAQEAVRRWLNKQSDKICDELSHTQVMELESIVATALLDAETRGRREEKLSQQKRLAE